MGEEYVAIWAKCLRDRRRPFKEILKKDWPALICYTLMLVLIILSKIFLTFSFFECTIIPFSVIAIVLCIVPIFLSKKKKEGDPIKRFQNRIENAPELVGIFLNETGLAYNALPNVLKSVQRYKDELMRNQHTFTNNVFAIFLGGIFVQGISWFFNGYKEMDSDSIAISYIICGLAISMILLIISARTSIKGPSISKTKSLVSSIECVQLMRNKQID